MINTSNFVPTRYLVIYCSFNNSCRPQPYLKKLPRWQRVSQWNPFFCPRQNSWFAPTRPAKRSGSIWRRYHVRLTWPKTSERERRRHIAQMSTATICELISMAQGIKQEPEMKRRSIRRAGMWEAQGPLSFFLFSTWHHDNGKVYTLDWLLHSDTIFVYKVPLSPSPPPLFFHHARFISYLSPVCPTPVITQIRYQIRLKSVTMAPRVAIVFVCDPRWSTRGLLWFN